MDYKILKKYQFEETEANLIFSSAIKIAEIVKKADRAYSKKRIDVEDYIKIRKEIKKTIDILEKNMEEINDKLSATQQQ